MKQKKIIFSIVVGILLLTSIAFLVSALRNNWMQESTLKAKAIYAKPDKVVVNVEGEDITRNQIDAFKVMNKNTMTDDQVIQKIIREKVLYNDALKNGISYTADELQSMIEQNKKVLQVNATDYANIKDHMEALGLTEDQYWEKVKPIYAKNLVISKYKEKLRKDFTEKNGNKNKPSGNVDVPQSLVTVDSSTASTPNPDVPDRNAPDTLDQTLVSQQEKAVDQAGGFQEFYNGYTDELIKNAKVSYK